MMKKALTWLGFIGSIVLVFLTLGNVDLLKKDKSSKKKEELDKKVTEKEKQIKTNNAQKQVNDIQIKTLEIEKNAYEDLLKKQQQKDNQDKNRELQLESKIFDLNEEIEKVKSQLNKK